MRKRILVALAVVAAYVIPTAFGLSRGAAVILGFSLGSAAVLIDRFTPRLKRRSK